MPRAIIVGCLVALPPWIVGCATTLPELGKPQPISIAILPLRALTSTNTDARTLEVMLNDVVQTNGGLTTRSLGPEEARAASACGEDETCLRSLGRAWSVEKLLESQLVVLGPTTLARVMLYDVARSAEEGVRQALLRESTPERITATFRDLAVDVLAPYRVEESPSFYERWWFWVLVVGGVLAGVGTALAFTIGGEAGPDQVIHPP